MTITGAIQHGLILFACILLPCQSLASNQQTRKIFIGLRAHNGSESALKQWQPTADYLSEQIPGYRFIMVPHEHLDSLMQAASQNAFDFILTNPSSYVEMAERFNARALVTLINRRNDTAQSRFGSVIFVKADNLDIINIKDLKNKTLMGVSEPAFGGWQVGWLELLRHDIDPYSDLADLSWGDGNQHNVVYAVRNNNVDAGVVRTDMLERMAKDKLINLNEFRVLNTQVTAGFPFFHSTPLYPEWPFVAMQQAKPDLQEKVITALTGLSESHPASQAGKYVGWQRALSYEPVKALMQQLGVKPFKKAKTINAVNTKWWFLAALAIIALYSIVSFTIQYRQKNKNPI